MSYPGKLAQARPPFTIWTSLWRGCFYTNPKYCWTQDLGLGIKLCLGQTLQPWHQEHIPELSYDCNKRLIMVKKFLWLRVQRYFPKGSGIQQPGKSRVFKNPYSKTLTVHPILARGHCGTTIWVPMESLPKSLTQFWVECANSSFLGRRSKLWRESCRSGKLG